MSGLLVDTNIVSFVMKMTVAELYEGAYRAHWGEKRLRKLEREIGYYIILPSSTEICRRWGEVRYQRRQQPISAEDAWIAATALTYECPLVTHNPQDFRNIPRLRILTAQVPT